MFVVGFEYITKVNIKDEIFSQPCIKCLIENCYYTSLESEYHKNAKIWTKLKNVEFLNPIRCAIKI